MAERKISGADILLYIDPLGGTSYSLLVCLTKQSLKRTTNTIDAASKCGPDNLAGAQSVNVDFEGQNVWGPTVGRISGGGLHDLWAATTTVGWKMGPATPVSGDEIYSGTAFIAELSDDYDLNSPATFSGSLGVKGNITKIVTV